LADLLATLDPNLPVTMTIQHCPVELVAVVADHWYVPAEAGGVLYLGPHAVLTALDAVAR
jgi:hypothetical protein